MSVEFFAVMVQMEKDVTFVCGLCQLEACKRGLIETNEIDLEGNETETEATRVLNWPEIEARLN